jgi:hypothetical protein
VIANQVTELVSVVAWHKLPQDWSRSGWHFTSVALRRRNTMYSQCLNGWKFSQAIERDWGLE